MKGKKMSNSAVSASKLFPLLPSAVSDVCIRVKKCSSLQWIRVSTNRVQK